jgi:hypothetical protein
MNKPVKKVKAPAWNFDEICWYISKVHEIDSNKFKDWFIANHENHNGCYSYISIKEDLKSTRISKEVKQFLQLLFDEFNEDEMRVWIEW